MSSYSIFLFWATCFSSSRQVFRWPASSYLYYCFTHIPDESPISRVETIPIIFLMSRQTQVSSLDILWRLWLQFYISLTFLRNRISTVFVSVSTCLCVYIKDSLTVNSVGSLSSLSQRLLLLCLLTFLFIRPNRNKVIT